MPMQTEFSPAGIQRIFVNKSSDKIELSETTAGQWSQKTGSIQTGKLQVKVSFINQNELQFELEGECELISLTVEWNNPFASGTHILCDHWERAYGDLSWRDDVSGQILPWYFLAASSDWSETSGFGVKTQPNALCCWQLNNNNMALKMDLRSGNQPVLLKNRKLPICTLVYHPGEKGMSPFDSALAFCRKMCDNPRLPAGPVYGFNDWYTNYGNNSQESILENTETLAELTRGLDCRPYSVIDDGWQMSARTSGGPWISNCFFPDMAGLAAEMKAMDVRPGIWMRALITGERMPEHWCFKQPPPPENCPQYNALDPSVPEVLDLIGNAVKKLTGEWGYELVKHDFSSYDLFGCWGYEFGNDYWNSERFSFADKTQTTAEIIKNLYREIAVNAGDALIIGCNTISHLAAGFFQLQRTGDDTSGLEWARTRKMGINTLAFRMPQHRSFYYADADCVGVTDQVPWHLNKQFLDLLSRSGTPLFISANKKDIQHEQRIHFRKAFERTVANSAIAEPLDWTETKIPSKWKLNDGEIVEYDWSEADGDR